MLYQNDVTNATLKPLRMYHGINPHKSLINKVFIRMFFRFWIMRYGIGYAIPHFLSRE